jgi:chaperonin GroEL
VITDAIRPTLGPFPRLVAIEKFGGDQLPEILDDGAMIARRIIQIRPRGWDVGAMLIRQALWEMHIKVGDGTTTMAIMYQSILEGGIRCVEEMGCNAMLLRSGLGKGLHAIQESLRQEATPLIGKQNIACIARGMCQDDFEMAEMMGEIFDIVGTEGMIVVEGSNKHGLEREYVEGTYWDLSGWFSRLFVTDLAEKRTVFEDAALLISNLALTDPNQIVPVLEKCVKAGVKKLVIIAKEQVANIEDIAVLTGGKAFYAAANDKLEDFQVHDLGYARRAWATESLFGIYGGKGDPRLIRRHIALVQGMQKMIDAKEEHEKEKFQKRLGRLLGGTAILRVGGITDTERETRKVVASRAIAALRNAIRGGVVPGGGVALLKAQSTLEALSLQEDEAMALRILARALEEPLRTIAKNVGYVPDVIIEKVKSSPRGYGFDARTGKIVDMQQNGLVDPVIVLEKALEIAVSGAAMALTTDVIVHHTEPKESIEP